VELGVASGTVSTAEVLSVLAPAWAWAAQKAESDSGGHVSAHPSGDGAFKAYTDALMDVAGALQVSTFEGGPPAFIFTAPKSTMMVHPFEDEWRLEVLSAFPMFMPVEAVLSELVPLVAPTQCVRTQTRALISLYVCGVRCGAPLSGTWRSALRVVPVEKVLLECVAFWQAWLTAAKGTHQPAELLKGRYTLAEALRCIGRFGHPLVAKAAADLIGVGAQAELVCGPNWRGKFCRFVERRRRCPITSAQSLF